MNATGLLSTGPAPKAEPPPARDRSLDAGLLDRLRRAGGGATRGRVTVRLARAFGFCRGVARAVRLVAQARRDHPDRRMILTGPLVHNPQVNAWLAGVGVAVPGESAAEAAAPPRAAAGDVAVIAAFGATPAAEARLRASGARVLDATCGYLKSVWAGALQLAREGFTIVLHGDPSHEEVRATLARIESAGGRWIAIRDAAEAERLAAWLARTNGRAFPPLAGAPGLDPARDLDRIGLVHQTTKLAAACGRVAETLRAAASARDGRTRRPHGFRELDTLCVETQARQDAVADLGHEGVDLLLVVGGRQSSNTRSLAAAAARWAPAYHIEGPEDLLGLETIRCWNGEDARSPKADIRHHCTTLKGPLTPAPHHHAAFRISTGWLPRGPITVGVTAGASTPDAVTAEVVERVLSFG